MIFTNGCFDILHRGHIHLLTEARNLGDWLVVAINDDKSVRRLKGENRPINTLEDRTVVLNALECVDRVIPFTGEEDLLEIINEIKPDLLVKGGDYKAKEIVGSEMVKVKIIPYLDGHSTSIILQGQQDGKLYTIE